MNEVEKEDEAARNNSSRGGGKKVAGSQREYELLFKLKATLGGNFNSTFKTAVDTQKRLCGKRERG